MQQCLALLAIALTGLFLPQCAVDLPGPSELAPVPLAVSYRPDSIEKMYTSGQLKQEVPVFIFSNRKLREQRNRLLFIDPYSNFRNEEGNPNVSLAKVSIGRSLSEDAIYAASVGGVDRKEVRVKLESVELMKTERNPDGRYLLQGGLNQIKGPWLEAIRAQLRASRSRKITVFVHGFNTHLSSNTEFCAELFHYTGRDGVIINFDWPSRGRIAGYFQDKGNADQSVLYLRWLLSDLAKEVNAKSISIIGHSAGCPVVVTALKELRLIDYWKSPEALQRRYKIDRVVLAAPDMGKMTFFNSVYDKFYEVANKVAVYVSPDDKALRISQLLFQEERLGRSFETLNKFERKALNDVKDLEVIDVRESENIFATFLGHGYFHRDPWVSSDISLHIRGLSPRRRGLERSSENTHWYFPSDYPTRLRDLLRKPLEGD